MLYKFIKKGRATFVEILLNHSVDLEKFLGKNKMWLTKLYKNVRHFVLLLLVELDRHSSFSIFYLTLLKFEPGNGTKSTPKGERITSSSAHINFLIIM